MWRELGPSLDVLLAGIKAQPDSEAPFHPSLRRGARRERVRVASRGLARPASDVGLPTFRRPAPGHWKCGRFECPSPTVVPIAMTRPPAGPACVEPPPKSRRSTETRSAVHLCAHSRSSVRSGCETSLPPPCSVTNGAPPTPIASRLRHQRRIEVEDLPVGAATAPFSRAKKCSGIARDRSRPADRVDIRRQRDLAPRPRRISRASPGTSTRRARRVILSPDQRERHRRGQVVISKALPGLACWPGAALGPRLPSRPSPARGKSRPAPAPTAWPPHDPSRHHPGVHEYEAGRQPRRIRGQIPHIPVGRGPPLAPSSNQHPGSPDRSAKGLWAISSSGRSNEKSWRRTRECYTAPVALHAGPPRQEPSTPPHTLAAKRPFIYSPRPLTPRCPSGGIGRRSGLKSPAAP